jgi:hypothetical protein
MGRGEAQGQAEAAEEEGAVWGVVKLEFGASWESGEGGGCVWAGLGQEERALGFGNGCKKRGEVFLVKGGASGALPSTQRVATWGVGRCGGRGAAGDEEAPWRGGEARAPKGGSSSDGSLDTWGLGAGLASEELAEVVGDSRPPRMDRRQRVGPACPICGVAVADRGSEAEATMGQAEVNAGSGMGREIFRAVEQGGQALAHGGIVGRGVL